MKTLLTKTAAQLSILTALSLGAVSMQAQANADKSPFISSHFGETLAYNTMGGKPPYNRLKMKRKREQVQQAVEMSALEIDHDSINTRTTKKAMKGGHPYHARRHSRK